MKRRGDHEVEVLMWNEIEEGKLRGMMMMTMGKDEKEEHEHEQ